MKLDKLLIGSMIIALAGCGGDSGSDNTDPDNGSTMKTGVFLDSPVSNIG